MISPASFNYYQECLARAEELYILAATAYITIIREDMLARANALLQEIPPGILLYD